MALVGVAIGGMFGAGDGWNLPRKRLVRARTGRTSQGRPRKIVSVGLGCHSHLLHSDPWIDDTVKNVDDEVAQDRHHGDDEYDPQEHWEVASLG